MGVGDQNHAKATLPLEERPRQFQVYGELGKQHL
jgi:hypothetical protein